MPIKAMKFECVHMKFEFWNHPLDCLRNSAKEVHSRLAIKVAG